MAPGGGPGRVGAGLSRVRLWRRRRSDGMGSERVRNWLEPLGTRLALRDGSSRGSHRTPWSP